MEIDPHFKEGFRLTFTDFYRLLIICISILQKHRKYVIKRKKLTLIKEIRNIEKELVRLNYKEAIIKGFTLKGIQQYIASKTKIWIEWSCLEYLKKSERAGKQGVVFKINKGSF